MTDLDREIAELKEEIEGYKTEYKTASGADKSELRSLIKITGETLNILERKAQSEAQGKIYCNYQQYLMEFYDFSSWLYN